MLTYSILYVVLVLGVAAILSWPLGRYMKWAMDPATAEAGSAGGFTRAFQALGGSFTRAPQDWKRYMVALLAKPKSRSGAVSIKRCDAMSPDSDKPKQSFGLAVLSFWAQN